MGPPTADVPLLQALADATELPRQPHLWELLFLAYIAVIPAHKQAATGAMGVLWMAAAHAHYLPRRDALEALCNGMRLVRDFLSDADCDRARLPRRSVALRTLEAWAAELKGPAGRTARRAQH